MQTRSSALLRRFPASAATIALAAALTLSSATLWIATASASGYDTPIIHTARNIAMGGTAIGHVNDASALYHNPAGLGHTTGGQAMISLSPLTGQLQGSPSAEGINIPSESALIPMFLAGAAYNVADRLTFGLGVFPLGGGSGEYKYSYDNFGDNVDRVDSTSLAFIEVVPAALAYEFDFLGGKMRIGAAYRVTIAQFQRNITNTETGKDPVKYHDINMQGMNTTGFRVGIQGTYGDLDIGLTYRSGFTVDMDTVEGHETKVNSLVAEDAKFQFKLPSTVGVGARLRLTPSVRLAADMQMLINSENDNTSFTGKAVVGGTVVNEFKEGDLVNYANWDDGLMMRFGAEYMVSEGFFARAGYVYDTKSANTQYPSAFGTPPGPTQSFTAGAEYAVTKGISFAAAFAYRSGEGNVEKEQLPDPAKGEKVCAFCGKEGVYKISMMGAYLDAVFKF